MKGVAAGVMLAAVSAAPAMAADLPVAAPVEPAFVPAAVYSFTGFYVGIQGGYAFEGDNDDTLTGDDVTFSLFDNSDDEDGGFVVGGTVGFNYQVGNFVLGVEGDASYADFGETEFDIIRTVGTTDIDVGDASLESNFFATARGRIGYTFDRFMLFATGGAAFVGQEFESTGTDLDGTSLDSSDDDFLFGYTVGGGVEAFLTPNITAKVEYLYVALDDDEFFEDSGMENNTDFHVVRGGLNFKFNSLFGGGQ